MKTVKDASSAEIEIIGADNVEITMQDFIRVARDLDIFADPTPFALSRIIDKAAFDKCASMLLRKTHC
jgi:hypothetical protein